MQTVPRAVAAMKSRLEDNVTLQKGLWEAVTYVVLLLYDEKR